MSEPAEPVEDIYALYQEGRARLRAGHPAQATVPLERARRAEPQKASIREALGIAYFRLARWRDAAEEFRAVVDLSPTDAYAHRALARCLAHQGERIEAARHYKLASLLEPGGTKLPPDRRELEEAGGPGGPGDPANN